MTIPTPDSIEDRFNCTLEVRTGGILVALLGLSLGIGLEKPPAETRDKID